MKNVLIFGINGFVGSYLAAEFYANGYEVYGSSRIGGMKRIEKCAGMSICDLLDADQVKNVICEVNPEIIVNLAGRSSVGISWRIPKNTLEVNVCGALNILEAIRTCDLDCKVLMIGSSEEYDASDYALTEDSPLNATNPYGISKVTLEGFARMYRERYGMKVYFVRSFNHTGVGQTDSFVIPSWCKQAAQISVSGKPGVLNVGNLEIVRDFSNVKDVVKAYRLILEKTDGTNTYNVGSGQAISLKKILEYICKLSDQKIEIVVDPKLIRPVENSYICCDHTLLTEDTGWEPTYSIYDTTEEIFNYYVELIKLK